MERGCFMPIYSIRHKESGVIEHTVDMPISHIDTWEEQNPEWEIAIGMPLIHSGMGLKKPDIEWREKLKAMKKAHPGSTINDF